MRLDQVTIPCSDLERSLAFYRRLGLLPIVRSEHYARLLLPAGGSTLSLHVQPAPIQPSTAILYFECDDLDARVAGLAADGVVFDEPPTDRPWLWREAPLRDPDGHPLILFFGGVNRLRPPWRLPESLEPPAPAERKGRCDCGAVRFTVRGPMRDVVYCHCSRCRRVHGHAGAYTGARREHLTIEGAEHLRWHAASDTVRRGFCTTCGSMLFFDKTGSGGIAVVAGALDAPTGLRSLGHIHVASRGDYYDLTDGLPAHPEGWPRRSTPG